MFDGLGFLFFVIMPLFGGAPIGSAVGGALFALRYWLSRKNPPNFSAFVVSGSACSALAVASGFLLVLHNGDDTMACMRYSWIATGVSAGVWLPCSVLAWFRWARKPLFGLGMIAFALFIIVSVLAALRLHDNWTRAEGLDRWSPIPVE
jgi:hypothetical protein